MFYSDHTVMKSTSQDFLVADWVLTGIQTTVARGLEGLGGWFLPQERQVRWPAYAYCK